jgi:hypothetical protein
LNSRIFNHVAGGPDLLRCAGWTATLTFSAGNALLALALMRARREPGELSHDIRQQIERCHRVCRLRLRRSHRARRDLASVQILRPDFLTSRLGVLRPVVRPPGASRLTSSRRTRAHGVTEAPAMLFANSAFGYRSLQMERPVQMESITNWKSGRSSGRCSTGRYDRGCADTCRDVISRSVRPSIRLQLLPEQ